MPKPTPTITDVSRVAQHFMSTNGSTTPLWVKNRLRKEGFWATQEVISALMDELDLPGLTYTFNGKYRTYSITAAADTADGNDDNNIVVQIQNFDFECWDGNSDTSVRHTYNTATRGQAKHQYARAENCVYFDVRSRKAR